jgi:hypothetical protein
MRWRRAKRLEREMTANGKQLSSGGKKIKAFTH